MGVVVLVLFLWRSTKEDRGQNVSRKNAVANNNKKRGGKSGNVDAAFIKKIKDLLRIVIPNYSCKEFKYVIILTLLLVLRT